MAANRLKDKGTRFETEVVRYLWKHGQPEARRAAMAGAHDQGDVHGIWGDLPASWRGIAECKAYREWPTQPAVMAAFRAQTFAERTNAGATFALLVVKRPNRGVELAECWVTLHDLAAMRGHRQLSQEPDDVWVCMTLSDACRLMGWSE